jgi:DUF1009 family protein
VIDVEGDPLAQEIQLRGRLAGEEVLLVKAPKPVQQRRTIIPDFGVAAKHLVKEFSRVVAVKHRRNKGLAH